MVLKKFYLKCLSHGSYLLADEESREAAVIDPQRDLGLYLDLLREEGFRLKYVLETHVHADFISGHWDLAEKTGAQVVFGARADAIMPHLKVKDGDELRLGNTVSIRILETPGHTPESICYLVHDLPDPEDAGTLFSGDTLFVGDVGRPDLIGARMPADALASMLYDTVENKLKTLPDATRVYPAHGAGSACGKHIGDAEFTTIGEEKSRNAALRTGSREEFIRLVTSDLPDAPGYFAADARLNRVAMRPLDEFVREIRRLTPSEADDKQSQGALILDTRSPGDYAAGAIPYSLNIGLDGQFAPWLGILVRIDTALVLICDPGREEDALIRCGRIGYENIQGVLEGGMERWKAEGRPMERYSRLSPSDFLVPHDNEDPMIVDVRNESELQSGAIPGSISIPLNRLGKESSSLKRNVPIRVYCGSGYRSAMAVSLLKGKGWKNVSDLAGGFSAYRQSGLPIAGKSNV